MRLWVFTGNVIRLHEAPILISVTVLLLQIQHAIFERLTLMAWTLLYTYSKKKNLKNP